MVRLLPLLWLASACSTSDWCERLNLACEEVAASTREDVVDQDGDVWDAEVDCDDLDPEVNPGAEEVCDSIDNNCDGQVDEGVSVTGSPDADGDGYGDQNVVLTYCSELPSGWVTDSSDCADKQSWVHPSQTETCGDGVDNNCDGQIDEAGCLELVPPCEDGTYAGFADPGSVVWLSSTGKPGGDGSLFSPYLNLGELLLSRRGESEVRVGLLPGNHTFARRLYLKAADGVTLTLAGCSAESTTIQIGGAGGALMVSGPGAVTVRDLSIEGSSGYLFVVNKGANATIERVHAATTHHRAREYASSALAVTRSTATLDGVVLSGGRASLRVDGGSHLFAENVTVNATEIGVELNGEVEATFEGLSVVGDKSAPKSAGISNNGGDLTLHDSTITDTNGFGLLSARGDLYADGLTVERARANGARRSGVGVYVNQNRTAHLGNVSVSNSDGNGIYIVDTPSVILSDCSVTSTERTQNSPGDGITVRRLGRSGSPHTASFYRCSVNGADRMGIVVDGDVLANISESTAGTDNGVHQNGTAIFASPRTTVSGGSAVELLSEQVRLGREVADGFRPPLSRKPPARGKATP